MYTHYIYTHIHLYIHRYYIHARPQAHGELRLEAPRAGEGRLQEGPRPNTYI